MYKPVNATYEHISKFLMSKGFSGKGLHRGLAAEMKRKSRNAYKGANRIHVVFTTYGINVHKDINVKPGVKGTHPCEQLGPECELVVELIRRFDNEFGKDLKSRTLKWLYQQRFVKYLQKMFTIKYVVVKIPIVKVVSHGNTPSPTPENKSKPGGLLFRYANTTTELVGSGLAVDSARK